MGKMTYIESKALPGYVLMFMSLVNVYSVIQASSYWENSLQDQSKMVKVLVCLGQAGYLGLMQI